MGFFKNYVSQTRKPEGFWGKMMIKGMNSGHAKMADWAMSHLEIKEPEYIAELGCGGGRNAGALLKKYPSSYVTAIDYSPLSAQKAKEYNKQAIREGRCSVYEDDVSHLNLAKNKYDLATAFETVYFWPDIRKCFQEVFSILKGGGYFMIVNESNGTDKAGKTFEKIIDGMKVYTEKEIKIALENAGFSEIKTVHYIEKPWITVIAKKQDKII